MMKRLLINSFVLICLLLSVTVAYAQDKTISGKVTSKDDGTPLPGVTVMVKGTTVGTQTDIEGMYKLSVSGDAKTLVFSFIGMATQEVEIGTRSSIDLSMASEATEIGEVVVTALGFREDRDKSATSATKVKTAEIVRSGETGLISGMSGKTAGLNITKSSGDPGAGAFIQIRGASTITNSTQPLIVVDGMPISNSSTGATNGLGDNQTDGVTQQSRLNDLNPEDIESVQVLKGAAAAAVWGSAANNGVIVITTKKGKQGKLSLTYKGTISFDEVNKRVPLQSRFGQGAGGIYSPSAARAWGDEIALRSGAADAVNQTGASFLSETGKRYYPITQKNSKETFNDKNFDQIFRTGYFIENNLTVGTGDANGSVFFSISDLRQKGVMRAGSDYNRMTARLNVEKSLGKIVRVGANTTYTNVTSNRVQKGSNLAGLFLGMLRTPADFDNTDYKGTYYSSATDVVGRTAQRSYRRYLGQTPDPVYNNPAWTIYQQENTSDVQRFIGNIDVNIKPLPWLEFILRPGIDTYTDQQMAYSPVNSASYAGGRLVRQSLSETKFNLDAMAKLSRDFGKDFSTSLILGFNYRNTYLNNFYGDMNTFILADGPKNFDNAGVANKTLQNFISTERLNGGYAVGSVSYKNMLFVNGTARMEASSAFGPKSDATYLFGSAEVAWQFTQLEALKNNKILSFGKLRASYGSVGLAPRPYAWQTLYNSAVFQDGWGTILDAGVYGLGGYARSTSAGNVFLRPERKTEIEIGTDLRFLNDYIRFSFTYYQNNVKDLLTFAPVPFSTGFRQQYGNVAEIDNKGIELEIGTDIIRKGDFKWSVDINMSLNRNNVVSLGQGNNAPLTLSGFTGSSSVATLNNPMSAIWGSTWQREGGKLVLDANGFPQLGNDAVIGQSQPNWRGGLSNTFSWKNFTLTALIETVQGYQVWNGTKGALYVFGTHGDLAQTVTTTKDIVNSAGTTIKAGTTFRGAIKNFGGGDVALDETWYQNLGGGFGGPAEQFLEDASWVRLREVSVAYTLKTEGFKKLTKLSSAEFMVTGRNLGLITNYSGIDPETNLTGATNGQGLDYFNSPNTRSYLFTLRLTY
jgi:TonB-linked SusC/RagA family outer membrane protein